MKKIFTLVLVLCSFLSYSQSTTLVISQVYGGGGNSGAPFKADFVELHNISATAQSTSGLSVQYASSAATGAWTGIVTLPAASIPAGGYYLVRMSAIGTTGADLPTPDANPVTGAEVAMSSTNGRVALVNGTTAVTACPTAVIDLVGFGSSVCFEGAAATGVLSNSTAALRKANGCTDTNNNGADFTVEAPAPRNSASAAVVCGSSTTPALTVTGSIAGFGNVTVGASSASQTFNLSGSNLTGFPGVITITAPSADFEVSTNNTTFSASVTVPFTSATLASTPVYVRFSPQTAGLKAGNISITGGGQSPALTVALNGTGVAATVPTLTTAGTVNDFGNVTILTNSASQSFTVSGTNLTGFPGNITITAPSADFQVSSNNTTFAASTTIPYTSATLAATTVYVRFTPQTVGVKTGNISITGGGTATAVTVAISGTGVNAAPPSGSQVRISQVYGGGGNTSATYNQDFVELFNSGTTAVDISGWSVQYASFSGPSGAGDWNGAILPAGSSIGAGKYFLVSFAAVGTVGANLPTADFVGPVTTNLSGTAGKVALVNNSTILNGTTACSNASVVDVLGFSTTANIATCAEGNTFTTTGIDNTKSMYRKSNGCTDTDNNLADFELGTVLARNSATAANVCSVAPVNPALTTAGTINDFGSVVVLTNSASQSFTVSGTNLTGFPGVITITAPSADFQVSNDNTTFAASATIPYTSATLAATPVYVRFTPQTQGVKTGNVTISGGGVATALTIAVSGNGISATAPAVTTTALAAFGNICTGTTSVTNSFTINGVNLTNENVTVAALAGYAYSTSATGPFTATLSLTQPGGTYSQEIFVQLTAAAVQSYNGNIVVAGGGLATPVNVAATGAGVNTTATVATGAATTITVNSAVAAGTISANGCTAVTAYGIEYSTTNNFPTGTGTKVVSTNISSGVFTSTLTALTGATVYYYRAYATNGGGTAYGAQLSFTTVAPPPAVLVAGPLTAFGNVCLPGSAGPNLVNLGGANLTTANVVVGPLAGYSFSTTATGTFTPSLTITQPGGTFSQAVYVKFTPTAAQSYNGNIPLSGGGIASAVNIPVTGAGLNTPPAVAAVAASAISTTTAQLNATISSIGCSAVTTYGFEYSSINGFANGQGTVVASNNQAGGNFSISLSGLAPGATYYYKAFAQNANGKTYSAQVSFTTFAVGQGLIVYSTPALRGGKLSFSLNPIKPGHYAAALYNMAGQKVFKKEMLVQIGFINDSFIIPGFIPSGVYIFQIENYEYKIRKQIIIK
ncbi:lamin tail domain-containing protein [Ferruginibacter sp. HRS2-29]|uniref:lamin tail domain-containing protein n=1 Tax=Ferruginibacter sp. HRS2-29 TaxID=2487334 RepID=UPI0020CE3A34|nr:lamin tail domain-containing protein [Ferruginibacter sp. HRS2-29]MCP9750862.1 choice-of-anchor D domain-containing protein [Ferruginibacter sp. HRS2-29]